MGQSNQVPRPRCAVIFRDLSNYHIARLNAVSQLGLYDLNVIEITQVSEYPEFKASHDKFMGLSVHELGVNEVISPKNIRDVVTDLLAKLKPDLVFIPGWSEPEALVSISWCVKNQTKFVIMSESTHHDFARNYLKEFVKSRIVSLASSYLVGGTMHSDYLQKLGVESDQIFLGYDVVDTEKFTDTSRHVKENEPILRDCLGLPKRYIFCAARLIEKKNLFRLISAFKLYLEDNSSVKCDLVIAGPGPLKKQLELEVSRFNLDEYVHLTGALSYADIRKYYGLAEAFILPSTTEQWGLVVNEAMASGLPVLISSRCGSVADLLVEGENGYSFDPFDIESIYTAISMMMRDSSDRVKMGKLSQKIVAGWGPERFAQGFADASDRAMCENKSTKSLLGQLFLSILVLK